MIRTSILLFSLAFAGSAEDWPEFRGKGRLGVWNETGILDRFPAEGLKIRWRAPVQRGFSGPAVAAGRVYISDFAPATRLKGVERVLCLDEKTGAVLWTREWPASYQGLMETYASGPRATPTVDGDRVYAVGAKGLLYCLNSRTGEVMWHKDYVADYDAQVPVWGIAGAPLVDGERLICLVGGAGNAKVMAFDKKTGKEIWRALPDGNPGYSQPIIIQYGKTRQLIVWHPRALSSLNPATGEVYWEEPFKVNLDTPVVTPVQIGARLFVSAFYDGTLMMALDDAAPRARLSWKGKSNSEIKTDGLHSLVGTPAMVGDYIYGVCSYGQMRCVNAKTGERVWETMEVTKERARWAAAFLVRNGDRFFINNDHGELILAQLSPEGYRELSRTKLITPTSNPGNRRELGAVHWSHPAYANGHIIVRNDEEAISARLLP